MAKDRPNTFFFFLVGKALRAHGATYTSQIFPPLFYKINLTNLSKIHTSVFIRWKNVEEFYWKTLARHCVCSTAELTAAAHTPMVHLPAERMTPTDPQGQGSDFLFRSQRRERRTTQCNSRWTRCVRQATCMTTPFQLVAEPLLRQKEVGNRKKNKF